MTTVILTIAGFDPSAGAGTLADIKTISAFGCYGIAAVTSLTYQNTQGVFGSASQSREVVAAQLRPLAEDFSIDAIKTGMLPAGDVIDEVAEFLSALRAANRLPPLVVDPVVRSTSGYDLIDDDALNALITTLFPLAAVVTPNAVEAERITGIAITDRQAAERAAEAILSLGAKSVLITGGDLTGEEATDLFRDDVGVSVFSAKRIASKNTHGTGCTLSSALASLLALGYPLREAIPIAKTYLVEAIRTAPGLGKGHGPVNHFPPEY